MTVSDPTRDAIEGRTASPPSPKPRRAAQTVLPALVIALVFGAIPWPVSSAKPPANGQGAAPSADAAKPFWCGYDPRGAYEGEYIHLAARTRADRVGNHPRGDRPASVRQQGSDFTSDVGDVAVIEDDGTLIVPPSKFDLKRRSIAFVPEGDGYRVEQADEQFEGEKGLNLGFFFGVDGSLGQPDDGYHDLALRGAPFTFFGAVYDTIYVGTNGFITFTAGDTSARPSAAALASELPKIAPLWADLDLTSGGNVYYTRLEGRHVVTWDAVPQASFKGLSTFQVILRDDGRIVFVYKKVKARSAVVGIAPGQSDSAAVPVDFSEPPAHKVTGAMFESFSKKKRLDLPALSRAFFARHEDRYDATFIWTDFSFDNGRGLAHSFNVRNDIEGIGLKIFDRGGIYGSPSRLSTVITMGAVNDWPANPDAQVVDLNSAMSIVCHELGHRWLAYVRFDAERDIKDDLLGRQLAHWSFFVDSRTDPQGIFSSLMEGNSWQDNGNGTFTSIETAVNYFSKLDQYLMGLREAGDVGPIEYLDPGDSIKQLLRAGSPVSSFKLSALRKTTSVEQIVAREGPRVPSALDAPRAFNVAFILLAAGGKPPAPDVVAAVDRYRSGLVRYFSVATNRRASLDTSLANASAN